MRLKLLLIAGAFAVATPAHAGLLGPFFADFGTCYASHYDDEHLASHPEQRVTAVYLSNTAEPDPGYDGVLLEFGFVLRDGEHYSANAYCDDRDRCSLEGDGGTFRVVELGDGIQLRAGDFLGLEGRNGWSGDLTKSDDRVFNIFPDSPAPAASSSPSLSPLPHCGTSERPKAKSLRWSDFSEEGHESYARMAGTARVASQGEGESAAPAVTTPFSP